MGGVVRRTNDSDCLMQGRPSPLPHTLTLTHSLTLAHTHAHLREWPALAHAAHKRQRLLDAQRSGGALEDVDKVDVAVPNLLDGPAVGGADRADLSDSKKGGRRFKNERS